MGQVQAKEDAADAPPGLARRMPKEHGGTADGISVVQERRHKQHQQLSLAFLREARDRRGEQVARKRKTKQNGQMGKQFESITQGISDDILLTITMPCSNSEFAAHEQDFQAAVADAARTGLDKVEIISVISITDGVKLRVKVETKIRCTNASQLASKLGGPEDVRKAKINAALVSKGLPECNAVSAPVKDALVPLRRMLDDWRHLIIDPLLPDADPDGWAPSDPRSMSPRRLSVWETQQRAKVQWHTRSRQTAGGEQKNDPMQDKSVEEIQSLQPADPPHEANVEEVENASDAEKAGAEEQAATTIQCAARAKRARCQLFLRRSQEAPDDQELGSDPGDDEDLTKDLFGEDPDWGKKAVISADDLVKLATQMENLTAQIKTREQAIAEKKAASSESKEKPNRERISSVLFGTSRRPKAKS